MRTTFIAGAIVIVVALALLCKPENSAAKKQFGAAMPPAPALPVRHSATVQHEDSAVRIVATPQGFTLSGVKETAHSGPGWKSFAKPVIPMFPKSYTDAMRVRSGIADVSARPVGGRNSAGAIADDGSLVYKDAFEGCDVQYRCSALKTEEFIIVKDKAAQTSWSWNLDLGSGETALKPRLTAMHTIELVDGKGVPRLRIDAPEGKDGAGTLLRAGKRLSITLVDARITMTADVKGLKFPLAIDPTWSSTGSMAIARENFPTAIITSNGNVLVAGGANSDPTCELYDPDSGVWAATGSMLAGRAGHTATVLSDGKILVTGGANGQGPVLASCEIYDPNTGIWSATGSLGQARWFHTATLLQDGTVLVAGGETSAAMASCEIYNAVSGLWTGTGDLNFARGDHKALLLGNGSVIVVAGQDVNGRATTSCEIFSAGTWTNTGSLSKGRFSHDALILPSGELISIGGYDGIGSDIGSCELFNVNNGNWHTTGSLNTARIRPAAVLLGNGMVIATGGGRADFSAISSCEIYNNSSATWAFTDSMSSSRLNHSAVLIGNGKVLVIGGRNNNTCELFDPKPIAISNSISVHSTGNYSLTLNAQSLTQSLAYTISQAPLHGTLSPISGTGNVTYTPSGSYVGTDSFSFKVNDGFSLDSNVATVSIDVTDTAPVSTSQSVSTHLNAPVNITLAGSDADSDALSYVVTQPAHGALSGTAPNLTYTPSNSYLGADSFTFIANDGALDSNTATVSINVTDTAPVSNSQAVSTHFNVPVAITLGASDADNDVLTFTGTLPAHGVLTGTVPNLTYTPFNSYVGPDSFTFSVNDGALASNTSTVSINVTNHAPTATASGSPTVLLEGQTVSFISSGSDLDNDALTYSWNFGDGSTSTDLSPVHTYATAGTYNATFTVSDLSGATGSATVTIHVFKNSDLPVARFTTSDVVAFVGAPFAFDASFSTDPKNAIVSYAWSFGDDTPDGVGQIISKVYTQTGTVTASLTVTNAFGLSATISRQFEVLPANEIGLFNSTVKYTTKWDRAHDNVDTLALSATINVGDATVASGTAVALEIAGQRFTGTLDRKLRDFTNSDDKWQVQANIRGKPFGEAILKVQLSHANLGSGFNLAGAVATADLHDLISVDIPVRIELAGRVFDIVIPSDFKFSHAGVQSKGGGIGPK